MSRRAGSRRTARPASRRIPPSAPVPFPPRRRRDIFRVGRSVLRPHRPCPVPARATRACGRAARGRKARRLRLRTTRRTPAQLLRPPADRARAVGRCGASRRPARRRGRCGDRARWPALPPKRRRRTKRGVARLRAGEKQTPPSTAWRTRAAPAPLARTAAAPCGGSSPNPARKPPSPAMPAAIVCNSPRLIPPSRELASSRVRRASNPSRLAASARAAVSSVSAKVRRSRLSRRSAMCL